MREAITKIIIALTFFICFTTLHAQNTQAAATPSTTNSNYGYYRTDGQYFSIDIAFLTGYDIATNTVKLGRSIAVDLTVSPLLQLGIAYVTLSQAFPMLRMNFFILPGFGFSANITYDQNLGGGLGIFVDIIRSRSAIDLMTALKLRVEYSINPKNFLAGIVYASLGATIGY